MGKWYKKRYFSGQISNFDKESKISDKNKRKVTGFLTYKQRRVLENQVKYGSQPNQEMTNVLGIDVPQAMTQQSVRGYENLIPFTEKSEASTSEQKCALNFHIDVHGKLPYTGSITCEKNDVLTVKNEVKKELADENIGSGCFSSLSSRSDISHQTEKVKIKKEDTSEDATRGPGCLSSLSSRSDISHQTEKVKIEKEDTSEETTIGPGCLSSLSSRSDISHQTEKVKIKKEDTSEDSTRGIENDDECVIIDVKVVKNEEI